MHFAIRLGIAGELDGTSALPDDAVVTRGVITDITCSGNFGKLDLVSLQKPPADKPLFLQSISVDLFAPGMAGDSIDAVDSKSGASITLMNLSGVTSKFDSTGWLVPVGYDLRVRSTGTPSGSTDKHLIRLDFWQIENVEQVVSIVRSPTTGSSGVTDPAGGDLTGSFPNPYVSALRSGGTSLQIEAVGAGQFLKRDETQLKIVGAAAPTFDGRAAGGDLTGTYPNPYVSALRSGEASLQIDNVGAGQFLKRDATQLKIIGADAPTFDDRVAGGDLGGTYPNPTVTALHSADGTARYQFGNIGGGGYLKHDTTTNRIVGVSAPTYDGQVAGGDLSGTYPNPVVSALHTADGASRYVIDAIAPGKYLVMLANGHIGGGTPSGGSSVFGQGYTKSLVGTKETSTANWETVTTIPIPVTSTGQVWRLCWSVELSIVSGTDWALRLINQNSGSVLAPTFASNQQFWMRNLQQSWQVPYAGTLIFETPVATIFTCAMQVKSSTGEKVHAQNGLIELYRVT